MSVSLEAKFRATRTVDNIDVCSVNFVEFYCIFPTKALHINNICFLKHCYMFRRLYIILRKSLIVYAKVTKLIKWKHLCRLLLQNIDRLRRLNRRKINARLFVILKMIALLQYWNRNMWLVAVRTNN